MREGDAFLHNDPLPRQHPRRRSHAARPGLRRRRARLHRLGEGPPGRLRQLRARAPTCPSPRDVYEEGVLDLPLRPRPARLRGRRRHHPHVPARGSACRTSGTATTWRRSAPCRIGERRLQGAGRRATGSRRSATLHRRLARLLRAAMEQAIARAAGAARCEAEHPHDLLPGDREGPGQRRDRDRPGRGEDQVDLRDNVDCLAVRPQPVGELRDRGALHDRRLQLPGRPTCRTTPAAFVGSRCCCARARSIGGLTVPVLGLDGDDQPPQPADQRGPARLQPSSATATAWPRAPARSASASPSSPATTRATAAPYVNEVVIGNNGGPAAPEADGWVTYAMPDCAKAIYIDSVEVLEQQVPAALPQRCACCPTAAAPAGHRGGPGSEIVYGPTGDADAGLLLRRLRRAPAAGRARRRRRASPPRRARSTPTAPEPARPDRRLDAGARASGSAGWSPAAGATATRSSASRRRSSRDVLEGWVSERAAREVYGVVLVEDGGRGPAIDLAASRERREFLRHDRSTCN